jgi:hypothetical protein
MPTGKYCILPPLDNGDYCFLHDKETISVYFISDFENYKKGDIILGAAKEIGMNYIRNNVAIKLDRKLYGNRDIHK